MVGKNHIEIIITIEPIKKFIKDFFSSPKEFNNPDEIFVRPSGKSTQADDWSKLPLKTSLYKNTPVCSPAPKKNGIKSAEINSAKNIDDDTLFSIWFLSFWATAFVMSGRSAVDKDPIIVVGTKSNGRVIPTATPYRLIACKFVYPIVISLIGNIKAISGWIKEPMTLIKVIGEDCFSKGFK